MAEYITITINGIGHQIEPGATVAAALINVGQTTFRTSVGGEPRGPVCGMGVCFECRVRVDGITHSRACMLPCVEGMVIDTDG